MSFACIEETHADLAEDVGVTRIEEVAQRAMDVLDACTGVPRLSDRDEDGEIAQALDDSRAPAG